MDDITYFITIASLTLFMVMYGGQCAKCKLEYENFYNHNEKNIMKMQNIMREMIEKFRLKNTHVVHYNCSQDLKWNKICNAIMPNYVSSHVIRLESGDKFIVENPTVDLTLANCLQIIFVPSDYSSGLELVVSKSEKHIFCSQILKFPNISDVKEIYNGSSQRVWVGIVIVKKPYWHV